MKKIVAMLITTSFVLGMFSGCAEKLSIAASSSPPPSTSVQTESQKSSSNTKSEYEFVDLADYPKIKQKVESSITSVESGVGTQDASIEIELSLVSANANNERVAVNLVDQDSDKIVLNYLKSTGALDFLSLSYTVTDSNVFTTSLLRFLHLKDFGFSEEEIYQIITEITKSSDIVTVNGYEIQMATYESTMVNIKKAS